METLLHNLIELLDVRNRVGHCLFLVDDGGHSDRPSSIVEFLGELPGEIPHKLASRRIPAAGVDAGIARPCRLTNAALLAAARRRDWGPGGHNRIAKARP